MDIRTSVVQFLLHASCCANGWKIPIALCGPEEKTSLVKLVEDMLYWPRQICLWHKSLGIRSWAGAECALLRPGGIWAREAEGGGSGAPKGTGEEEPRRGLGQGPDWAPGCKSEVTQVVRMCLMVASAVID